MSRPPALPPERIVVRVPATSANLGPGFDCLGLALSLYDEVDVSPRSDPAVDIDIGGIGAASLPRDERHLLLRSLRIAAENFGLDVKGVRIQARNEIAQGCGLGSSAAAITAGVAAAWMLVPGHVRLDRDAVLSVAASIEGHPDNVAACVHGGLTISWWGSQGARAAALDVHPDVGIELFVPDAELSTQQARGLLPETVPHTEAAFNVGRGALLIHALTVAPELLLPATEDRLHQAYRGVAIPESIAVIENMRRAGIAAVLSGAGPSVLALTSRGGAPGPEAALVPSGWSRIRLEVADGVEAFGVADDREGP